MIPYNYIEQYDLGFMKVDTEPVAMVLAFFVFIILVVHGMKKEKYEMEPKDYFTFFFIVLFSSLAGGRLWYFIANWDGPGTIIEIFNLMVGGLVSLGMIIGGAVGLVIYALLKKKKSKEKILWQLEFARFADIIAAPAALAYFIYRLFGCTIYGDILGTPTNVPWCFMWPDGICRHPASVYLALNGLFTFIVLKVFFGREKR